MIRLIASDVDGTVADVNGRISRRVLAALSAAAETGVAVLFLTGRAPQVLRPLPSDILHNGLIVCSNGAIIYDYRKRAVLRFTAIELESAVSTLRAMRRLFPSSGLCIETTTHIHADQKYLGRSIPKTRYESALATQIDPETAKDLRSPIIKILCRDDSRSPEEMTQAFRGESVSGVSATFGSLRYPVVEVTRASVSKGAAMLGYASSLGIEPRNILAFGDMPNDIDMLQKAGYGFAMGGGHPATLTSARFHAPPLSNDGVAQVVEQLILSRCERAPDSL